MNRRLRLPLLSTILVLAGLLLTVSCGGDNPTTSSTITTTTTTSSTTSTATTTATTSTGLPTNTATDTGTPTADWEPDGVLGDGEYPGEARFGNYEIRWSSDGANIYVGISARTDGWVAVGFEPDSRMLNADIVIGSVQGGAVTVTDQYSTGTFGPHSPDVELGGSDDIIESGGREEGGFTTIEFSRPLVTGDRYDHDLAAGSIHIIWSYGTSDDTERQHVTRGTGEIDL